MGASVCLYQVFSVHRVASLEGKGDSGVNPPPCLMLAYPSQPGLWGPQCPPYPSGPMLLPFSTWASIPARLLSSWPGFSDP